MSLLPRSGRARTVVALAATAAIVLPLGWLWQRSLLPDTYDLAEMGYADYGGGPRTGHAHHDGTPVAALVGPDTSDPADVRVELVAGQGEYTLPGGRSVDGFSINGSSPGPVVRATRGQLVEVTFRNDDVEEGATLHWHGIDVPNAMDGVAGVTQDAVLPGESYTYRFRADQVGTYWYHSHQVSHEQVKGGLLGAVVITPREGVPQDVDEVVLTHLHGGTRTLNGRDGDLTVAATPGQRVRLRVVNTDNGPIPLWANVPYRVVAVDGHDVHEPDLVEDESVQVTAGGRVDLEVVVPPDGNARLQVSGGNAVLIGTGGEETDRPQDYLDLLSYGAPADAGFDTSAFDREFEYRIGRRPGFLDGRPGMWWTINGHLFPDVPMFMVDEGDVVLMRIENDSGDVHPMHLHGHHAVVLSRDGEQATGSPWFVDSLNVENGEIYEIAFVADNPGLWMDHCHNLPHAVEGLVAHLMYGGVTSSFRVGHVGNEPE